MRLELSRRTDIALRAIRFLEARRERASRTELADAVGTSPDFAAKVLGPLVHAGVLVSEPGRGGGYEIGGVLQGLSMLDLIQLTEGLPPADRCVLRGGPCEEAGPCALHEAWSAARSALFEQLEGMPVGARTRGTNHD